MIDVQAVGIIALCVHVALRVLKSGGLDDTVPPRLRPPLAVALALLGAVFSNMALGISWDVALAEALLGAMTAMGAHDLMIGSLRDGKELFR